MIPQAVALKTNSGLLAGQVSVAIIVTRVEAAARLAANVVICLRGRAARDGRNFLMVFRSANLRPGVPASRPPIGAGRAKSIDRVRARRSLLAKDSIRRSGPKMRPFCSQKQISNGGSWARAIISGVVICARQWAKSRPRVGLNNLAPARPHLALATNAYRAPGGTQTASAISPPPTGI